jgi:hypothetical protein
MSNRAWMIGAAWVALSAAHACAQSAAGANGPDSSLLQSKPLLMADEGSSFYPQLGPPREDEQLNNGGVHFDLSGRYLNNYVYRGIDQSTLGDSPESALQFDGKMTFDLGKLPHPFIGLFVNVFNEDPISRFEEVRPYAGLEWPIKPLTIAGGVNAYLFPNRKPLDTTEVWARLSLDDSLMWKSERPLFAPYIYAAYDAQLYQGFYVEAGIHHDFVFEDVGFTLTPLADIAYVVGNPQFALPGRTADTGFQHYDFGLIGTYSLNTLFNSPRRFGEFSIRGYLFYTDGLANHLRADTRIWGGVGITFGY